MKRKLTAMLAAIACTAGLAATSMVAHAENPIVQTSFTPDPAPVIFGDELYVFTGCDRQGDNDFYYMTGWQCFSTKDMKNWTDHGSLLEDTSFDWCGKNDAWASQCIERNGKYYFYFTTTNKAGGGRAIGVAVADKPEGPYKDVLGKPLCGPNWDYIDPTVMIDDDGQAWLMFGNPTCYYVKLKEDMVTLDGEIKHFEMNSTQFGPPAGQHSTSYGEGPWIYKRGDRYYLVYAAFVDGFGGESMCYSTAPTVTGPWTYGGVIQQGSNCFTTHGGIIDYKDHSYFFYHKNGIPGGGSFNRSASCDEFTYNPDGSIPVMKLTNEGPKQLEYVNPYKRMEAEMMSWSEGIQTEKIEAGTLAIGFIQKGDYVKVSGVDFGNGANKFIASVASAGQGGKIEVHLDQKNGPIVGTVDVPVTGDWQAWEEVSCDVKGASSVHDVYFVFNGGDSYLFNVDWWKFEGAGTVPETTEPEVQVTLGDVNADGVIDVYDLGLAKRGVLKGFTDKAAEKAADVNGDGKTDIVDLISLTKYLHAQINKFEVVEKPTEPTTEKPTEPPTEPPTEASKAMSMKEFTAQCQDKMAMNEPDSARAENPGTQYGTVKQGTYFSTTCNRNKPYNILLPAGYDPSKKYPVLYCMHGYWENQDRMIIKGNGTMYTRQIIGNAIAAGEAKDMIVVFPYIYSSATQENCSGMDDNNNRAYDNFINDLTKDLMPHIEKTYSVKTGKDNTAITGFSMGGRESLAIGMTLSDKFGYIGAICPAPGVNDAYKGGWKFDAGKEPYLIMITAGGNDQTVYDTTKPYHENLEKNGVPHIWHYYPAGYHGDNSIHAHLYNFCRFVFQATN